MDLLSPTRGLKRLKEYCTPGKHQGIEIDTILVKHRFRNSMKAVQTLPVADIDSDHNFLVAKTCNRLKKTFQKEKPRWRLEKLYTQRQKKQDTMADNTGHGLLSRGTGKVFARCHKCFIRVDDYVDK
jgi:hypothetical protein